MATIVALGWPLHQARLLYTTVDAGRCGSILTNLTNTGLNGDVIIAPHLWHKILVAILRILPFTPGNLEEVLAKGKDLALVTWFNEEALGIRGLIAG